MVPSEGDVVWLVTGAGGMVGRDLVDRLRARPGEKVVALSRTKLDISDQAAVDSVVDESLPTVIVNCAAYTKVDEAETDEQLATSINGQGVAHLATAANRHSALLVQISTDFVFDGTQSTPYEPTDVPAPLSAYGRSKLAGEVHAKTAGRHLIVRTAWLFGIHGWNFVEAIRKQILAGRTELRVVDDQRGRPTYTPHLAEALITLVDRARADDKHLGIVHYADQSECTWFEFASKIVEELERQGALSQSVRVHPVKSSEFPRPAIRPAYSVLSTRRFEEATGSSPSYWEEGLRDYLRKRPS